MNNVTSAINLTLKHSDDVNKYQSSFDLEKITRAKFQVGDFSKNVTLKELYILDNGMAQIVDRHGIVYMVHITNVIFSSENN